jgi:SAM-dependent methyltransferase
MPLNLAEDRPPIPPGQLILRVTTSFDADSLEAAQQSFDIDAFTHLQGFERALGVEGRDFASFERILDFGCGCGRFLRHLAPLAETTELHGVDIDAEMIAWDEANLPFASYMVGPHVPPTPYPDGAFDLVLNHSVFSHLDEHYQDLWLQELQRITRPGGRLLLTVEGLSSWRRLVEASERVGEDVSPWRNELETRGIVFIRDDHFVGSTHPEFYHSTTHAPWYVMEHWSQYFDVLAYMPDGAQSQDLILLGRRPDDAIVSSEVLHARAPAPESSGPGAGMAPAVAQLRHLARTLAESVRQRNALAPETPAADDGAGEREAQMMREITMLRAGLYEQGKRVGIIAADLQREIDELRQRTTDSSPSV